MRGKLSKWTQQEIARSPRPAVPVLSHRERTLVMETNEKYTATLKVPLGDATYSATRTSVKVQGPTYSGGPATFLVLESVSDASLDEAKLNLAELAGRITKALDREFGNRR